ncbi:MAG: hypothetical protein JRF31_10695 [Deltaproteobacteria bacterium]|nr:hypothetical protein [Deltaproteobacteria bacterium]MBW1958896.1 hypothetical protein [Deltaproteobacteria bacterium]MBW2014786.1 hypothetical protein [Deltaproteobacteria bacterium]MBW2087584.1 hypothetical protein [Deltaproteobacteria bacterium]MBW2321282.1 hypothetical protein [Deltaproteobacteria bacterium]
MIEILKKIFEDNPEKSTIVLNVKCSDCGCDVIIEITPTSGGFGLLGGSLFKCSPDEYFAKCPDCYKTNPKINDHHKPKHIISLSEKITPKKG